MANNTVFFPGYSAGENAYKEIDKVCSPYGTKAVVISDEISINATKKYLDEATQDFQDTQTELIGEEKEK